MRLWIASFLGRFIGRQAGRACAALAVLVSIFPNAARSEDWRLVLLHPKSDHEVSGLSWDSNELTVSIDRSSPVIKARIKGQYRHSFWNLLFLESNYRVILPDKSGNFSVDVPIRGPSTDARFRAIGPAGQIENSRVVITFPEWEKFAHEPARQIRNRDFFALSAGLSMLSFNGPITTGGNVSFSEQAIGLKFESTHYFAQSRWGAGLTAHGTALPFTANPSGFKEYTFGLEGLLGYTVPWSRWNFGLWGGFYYFTTFVTSSEFGLQNQSGPEANPRVRYEFANRQTISAYAKFGLVEAGASLYGVSSHELGLGASWAYPLKGSKSVGAFLDYENISLNTNATDGTAVSGSNNVFTIGGVFGF